MTGPLPTCAELARETVHLVDLEGDRWRVVLDVFAPGLPRPEGSYKIGRAGFRKEGRPIVVPDNSPALNAWRDSVADVVWRRIGPRWVGDPLRGPLLCVSSFVLPRRKTEKEPPAPAIEHGLGDGDKLQRAVHDALTASGVWTDDAVVTSGPWSKRRAYRGEETGVRLRVGVPDPPKNL